VYVYCSSIGCEAHCIIHSTHFSRQTFWKKLLWENRDFTRRCLVSFHVTTHNLFTPSCSVRARARFLGRLALQTTAHRPELLATMIVFQPPPSRENHSYSFNYAIS